MWNSQDENLSEHLLETALVANLLANIGNEFFGKNYDVEKITTAALFHDASEILTGDLPTPVKYYNGEITTVYKKIEKNSEKKLIETLPKELQPIYEKYFIENEIVKIADKLTAYIKCLKELNAGNKEFVQAEKNIKKALEKIYSPELTYFLENCIDAFILSLDELTN